MAGADRMTIEEVVRKVLLDEHADVIREAVKAVAAEMMELEVSELIGAERGERRPEDRATHRNGYRRAALGHAGGRDRAADPQDPPGQLLPEHPGAAPALRAGAARRSSSRPMSAASRPGASTSWSRASGCGSPRARSAASARRWMSTSTRSGRGRWRAATRTCSSTRRSRRSATAAASSTRRW